MGETKTITLGGKAYVILPRERYRRLATLAKAANLPPLPKPDEVGNYPAVDYARASIARSIIKDRARLGLTQRELAERAGIRLESLSRIETGRHTPTVATIEKIDEALRHFERRRKQRTTKRPTKAGRK